ncbi:MAG: biotin synthase, partial [Patiriisocius sp.]
MTATAHQNNNNSAINSMATNSARNLQTNAGTMRHDWSIDEINALFAMPFNDLLFKAQTIHREYFNPNYVQVSTLLSIKTGACP